MKKYVLTKLGGGLLLGLSACSGPQPKAAPAQAALHSAPLALPTFTFQAPEVWRSRREGEAPVEPPDMERETWRVMVNQVEPLQRETPKWQSVRASETVELAMPKDSSFRCIAPPLEVHSEANMMATKFKAWVMTRSFLCSSDQFKSWTETQLQVTQAADGTRTSGPEAGLLLRDRGAGEPVRKVFVLMRSEPYKREATYGPPQILAEVPKGLDFD